MLASYKNNVMRPFDKGANNIAFIGKEYYVQLLL